MAMPAGPRYPLLLLAPIVAVGYPLLSLSRLFVLPIKIPSSLCIIIVN